MKKKVFCNEKFKAMLFTATFSMVIEYFMLLSDNIIVGHLIGEEGVAGLNLIVPIYSFVVFVCIMISMGTAICFSNEMGQFHEERAHQFFGQGMILAVGSGIVMALGLLLGKQLFFDFLNPSENVFQYAEKYYSCFILVALLMPAYAVLVDIVYNDGNMTLCNLSYIIQVGGNILLSVFLCIKIGIVGVCLGTVIGNLLSIIILFLHFFRKQNSLKFVFHINGKDMLRVFKFSITDAGTYLAWTVLLFALSKFVIVKFGDFCLPVLTVATSFMEINVVFDGIGQALEPLVEVYHGEKNTAGIHKVMHIANKTAIQEGIIMTAVLLIFTGALVKIFGIDNLILIKEAKTAVRIIAPCCVFYSLAYLYSSYYLYIEKISCSILILLLKDLIAPFILIFSLGSLFGMTGMWIGMALSPVAADLVSSIIIIGKYGRRKFPLLLEEKKIQSYDIELSKETILSLCENAEKYLMENDIDDMVSRRSVLLLEEFSTAVLEKNTGKKVLLECTIMIEDDICFILRDDGEIFDLTGKDSDEMELFRKFVVSYLKDRMEKGRYLMTTGYNRNTFRLKKGK